MQHMRVTTPTELTEKVLAVFTDDPAVSNLSVRSWCTTPPTPRSLLAHVRCCS
jgi:hypothetical protein